MNLSLRILYLEDDPKDAELVKSILESEGITSEIVRVERRAHFIQALEQENFDLIFCDYSLPSFDGISALEIAKEKRPDIPFIFVTGKMGEELAIETLRSGATDYVLKHNLSRLVPAVKRTLQELREKIERKRAEDALRESEKRYRTLVETMNEGLGVDDENGLLVYANDRLCEMLEYSCDEIMGRPVLSFFDEKNQNILKEQTERRKNGESESYRIEWIKKGGQKIITLLSPRPIFDENSRYRGSFALITDITEKLRLESIAQAVNTMNNIGYIFSGIRHEIGNPFNSIKMALSVLKQNIDSYSKDTVKEYADRMLSEISRIEFLLKAMKNFNMYETVKLGNTDMTDFMNKFLSLCANDYAKKGIKIDAAIPEPAFAYADPRALQQVLLNIMTNASDALEGREAPRITISVLRMAGMVNIRVEDNGCGMSDDQQEDLFKPFYTTKAKGTGLGLVIAKKMMTRMKGFIDIVSEKNKGTIVDLYIPEGIVENA